MFARTLRNGLFATAAAGALLIGFNMSPAAAVPLPFRINPAMSPLTSGFNYAGNAYGTPQATDIQGSSDSLIQQTGATTQTETGWLQATAFYNNGVQVADSASGLTTQGSSISAAFPNSYYGLYLTFVGHVSGITGFNPGDTGTVGAGDYTFTVYGDPTADTQLTAGDTTGASGTVPGVTDVGGNDVVLAVGNSVSGSVGFAPVTGAPFFNVLANFIVCNGTAHQGLQAGKLIIGGAAETCSTTDGTQYFVDPNPFYAFNFNSSITGSRNNLSYNPANHTATLNSVVADINFQVPEPATLSIFGMGLLMLAAFGWRRNKNKGATA